MPIHSNLLHESGVPRLTHRYEGLMCLADSLNVSAQVLDLLNTAIRNPHVSILEVGQILRFDVVLSARIIRIANTSYFLKASRICHTIEDALRRVGLREVARLIATSNMQRRAPEHLSAYGISDEQFNKSVRFNAIACQLIATEIKLDASLAYLLGLMRPLGILVLSKWAALHQAELTRLSADTSDLLLHWEESRFGLNHLDVACFITRQWGLPTSVSDALAMATAPLELMRDCPLSLILQTADALAASNRAVFHGKKNGLKLSKSSLHALGVRPSKLIEISRESLRQSQRLAA
jgi:HD-like signal output (HDOD) protein